jgi:ubiquinone/menaquinone biosynthesis C-methylase UbiE
MLRALVNLFYRLPMRLQLPLSKGWYEYISAMDRGADMVLMNYGWAGLDPAAAPLPLQPEDESNRYCLQLYHQVAGAVDLRGRDVLEVGCGRGGGAAYVARYLQPRSMTGLDLAANAIRFCRQHYAIPGLTFCRGRAERLPFPPASFDAVVNVESSHCYDPMSSFLRSVRRVLKPGGYLLYADHRDRGQVDALRRDFVDAGFTVVEEEVLNANVVRALELDNARKQALIRQKVPAALQHLFGEFAAMEGTRSIYSLLQSGEKVYLRVALQAG